MTKVGAEGPSDRGAVYCEVEGVASELPAHDLRQEGLFVPTPEPLAIDREVELFLRSHAGEIVLRGLVVQVIDCAEAAAQRRSPGYGVLFLDLKDADRTWINRTRAAQPAPAVAAVAPAAVPATAAPAAPATPPKTAARLDDAVERARAARAVGSSTLRTSTRAQLEAELASLKARVPSEMLGVSSPVDLEAAHRAFLALSKRYHPHVFARFDSPEITRLATEIFITYKRAYATLRSGSKEGKDASTARTEANDAARGASLPPKAAPVTSASMRPTAAASMRPPPAASMRPAPAPSMRPASVRPGPAPAPSPSGSLRPPGARTSIAPHADPRARRIADAELLLASAVRHLAATRFEQAELELAKAAALAPERVDIGVFRHLCRARAHKAGGRHDEAAASYRKVLELDPQHREAREVLEIPPERRRGGLVSKWLGRDEE